jgi:hypothetical protein
MRVCTKYLLLIFLGLLATSIANATPLTLNSKDKFSVAINFDSGAYWVNAGKMDISLSGFSNSAFCIEIGPSAGSGEITTENPSDYWDNYGNNGLYAAWLVDQYNPMFGYSKEGLSEQVAYAALQIAIWETIYDFDGQTHSGSIFSSYSSLNTSEEQLLAWVTASQYGENLEDKMKDGSIIEDFSGKYKIFVADFDKSNNTHGGINDGTRQELLIASPVPEPATMLLFGIGLLGISAVGRKKRV